MGACKELQGSDQEVGITRILMGLFRNNFKLKPALEVLMPEKRLKTHVSLKAQLRQERMQSIVLFLMLIMSAALFWYAIYTLSIEGPHPVYYNMNGSNVTMMCHCYVWGCYCCPVYSLWTLGYDFNTNQSDIDVYEGCMKYEKLPSELGRRSVDELSCKDLIDYLENGRRCTGSFNARCIYPYIANKKAVLERQIMVKNCTVS